VYHPTVKGTYYDMGHRYGTVLHGHGFKVSSQSKEKLDFGRESEPEVKRVFPEILEEIRGFADACNAPYEQLTAFMCSIGAFKAEPNCSVFASFTGSDVVFGRNYDFLYSFKKYTESYLTCPENGYSSLGHTDVFIGREDGINEKGLAIAMTGVSSPGNHPGVSFCLAIRCVLDKCANVDEGVRVLENVQHVSTFNYLLADKQGNIAVVEASPDKVRVRRPNKGEDFIVCTNHFVHPEMQDKEDPNARSTTEWDSQPRYATISRILKENSGKVNVRLAEKILSNHSGYVCSHQQKIRLGTIWSVIATLNEPQILRAEGHPCKASYRRDLRLNKVIQERRM
jgi:predicted choloylglycine hydrolase